jgi:prevent-host-death family protein
MVQVNVDDVQRNLQAYLERVEAGETLVIVQNNVPVAEIKPLSNLPRKSRPFGLCAGEFTVPDDFDAPLPPETMNQFEGQ